MSLLKEASILVSLKYAKNTVQDRRDYLVFHFDWEKFQIAQEFCSGSSEFKSTLEGSIKWFIERDLMLSEDWRQNLPYCHFGWQVSYDYLEIWYETTSGTIFSQLFSTYSNTPILRVYLPVKREYGNHHKSLCLVQENISKNQLDNWTKQEYMEFHNEKLVRYGFKPLTFQKDDSDDYDYESDSDDYDYESDSDDN